MTLAAKKPEENKDECDNIEEGEKVSNNEAKMQWRLH